MRPSRRGSRRCTAGATKLTATCGCTPSCTAWASGTFAGAARLMRKAALRGACAEGKGTPPAVIPGPSRSQALSGATSFAATAPDRLWTADVTYVNTGEGFLHLAFLLDACSPCT
jgi:transposase InsO family protein